MKTNDNDNTNEYRLEDFYLSEKNKKNKDRFDSFEDENDIENLKNNLLKTNNLDDDTLLNKAKNVKTIKREDIENEIISQDLDDTDDIFLNDKQNEFETTTLNKFIPRNTQGIETDIINLKSELFTINDEEKNIIVENNSAKINEETKNKISDLKEKLKNVSEEINSTNDSIEIIVSDIKNDIENKSIEEINENTKNKTISINEKTKNENIEVNDNVNNDEIIISKISVTNKINENESVENDINKSEIQENKINYEENKSEFYNDTLNNTDKSETEDKKILEESKNLEKTTSMLETNSKDEGEEKPKENYFQQIEEELKNLTVFIDNARTNFAKTLNINKEDTIDDSANNVDTINEENIKGTTKSVDFKNENTNDDKDTLSLNEEKKMLELRIKELELQLEEQKFLNQLAEQNDLKIQDIEKQVNNIKSLKNTDAKTTEVKDFKEKILEQINENINTKENNIDDKQNIQLVKNNEQEEILSEKIKALQDELIEIKKIIYENKNQQANVFNTEDNSVPEMLKKSKQIGEALDEMITKAIEENNEIENFRSENANYENKHSATSLTQNIYDMREALRNREIGNEFDEQYEIYQREKKLNEAKEIYLNELKKRNRLLTEELFLEDIQKNHENQINYSSNTIDMTNSYTPREPRYIKSQQQTTSLNYALPNYKHNNYVNNVFDNNYPYQKNNTIVSMPSIRFSNKIPTLKINSPQPHIPSFNENKAIPSTREASLIFNDDFGELKRKDMISAYVKKLVKSKKKY